jgi:hypothetical protein
MYTAFPGGAVSKWDEMAKWGTVSTTPAHPASRGIGLLSAAAPQVAFDSRGVMAAGLTIREAFPWAYVISRFQGFQANLGLTDKQREDGITKFAGVTSCLNSAYRGHSSKTDNAFLIGSWSKDTCIRPPRDVDMYYVLPTDVYHRYQGYAAGANKQSALLQEVKGKLLSKYPASTIKGDGPVVLADFYGWTVEVAPAFLWDAAERSFIVCDTKSGGRYMKTMPHHEVEAINNSDNRTYGNTRPLIRMLKRWQAHCNVPIRSFYLELLAVEFLDQWPYNDKGVFYYDWMCRDFFEWMAKQAHKAVYAPGTFERMWLGDAWKSKAESAHGRAAKYERDNDMLLAGDEWQKIFGTDIPRNV